MEEEENFDLLWKHLGCLGSIFLAVYWIAALYYYSVVSTMGNGHGQLGHLSVPVVHL